jgi:ABC-type transport system involved in multi-copper enzyme maturation permease subunit
MYLLENPVLQRELLVNLRTWRAFLLLFAYNALLGTVVLLAWPQEQRINLSTDPEKAKNLVNLFFLGQYMLVSLMSPSFAAGAITGEKERKTYESLLASPLKPAAIVLGKLMASLAHLAVLMLSSLPIVMLCLPLGGVSLYEVLTVYLGLMMSVVLFGMVSIACSSYFARTSSALVVSYLLILPMSLLGVLIWNAFGNNGELRLIAILTIFPILCFLIGGILFRLTTQRLLRPPDVGSEGKDVIDAEAENRKAVGLVINRDRFPDNLFAPAKRTKLLPDGANPVYDKEIRSEIFAQGTLMLRVVIQVSMVLALPLMCLFLFIWPQYSPWYLSYVVLFNMLVGPVFSAGSMTSERERETLDLLLTTILSPTTILWGKLFSGLRVASVLTLFLLWPLLLAILMTLFESSPFYFRNWLVTLSYLAVYALTCLTTSSIALCCSVLFRRTATAMMMAYTAILVLFTLPLALAYFANNFFAGTNFAKVAEGLGVVSPFAALFHLPISMPDASSSVAGSWPFFIAYLSSTSLLLGGLWLVMLLLFQYRWRLSD